MAEYYKENPKAQRLLEETILPTIKKLKLKNKKYLIVNCDYSLLDFLIKPLINQGYDITISAGKKEDRVSLTIEW